MDHPFVNIHTHRRTGEGIEVVSVMAGLGDSPSGALPAPPFSIGVHPWQLGQADEIDLDLALREVETAPASAIGEIGLDHAAPTAGDYAQQKMIFAAQLRIAEERRLPVILHCVRAFEPTMEILAAYRLPAVIFHGFVGSREQARRAVKAGYYLSFGERGLASPKTVEALREIPLEKMFLETDETALKIIEIYTGVAKILYIPCGALEQKIYTNYLTVFGK